MKELWSNKDLEKMATLFTQREVSSLELLMGHPDVSFEVQRSLSEEFFRLADKNNFGVDTRDLHVSTEELVSTNSFLFGVTWKPKDRPCLLINGPGMGEVMTVQRLPFRMPLRTENFWRDFGSPAETVETKEAVYDKVGWDPLRRMWLLST